jgi:hypothetical protein
MANFFKMQERLEKAVKEFERVTSGRHTGAPGKNVTSMMPHPDKPTEPKKHIRADTMTHMNLRYELGKSDAGQYHVDLGVPTFQQKGGLYAMWKVSKPELAKILRNWRKVQWDQRTAGRPSKEGAYHATARSRQAAPAPIRDYLSSEQPNPGNVLYHGIGRDKAGLRAIGSKAQYARGFDPYHPDARMRQLPRYKFNEVHSHYTLNVVPKNIGFQILKQIHSMMRADGHAVISVRRDLPTKMIKAVPMQKSSMTGGGLSMAASTKYSVEELQKAIPSGFIYVQMDGDNAGTGVKQAAYKDNVDAIADISERISRGNGAVVVAVQKYGGEIIINGGDDLSFLLPEQHIEIIDNLRSVYKRASGFTTTIGYATSIPNAIDALVYGKMTGKNRVVPWTPDISTEVRKMTRVITPQEKYTDLMHDL